MEDLEKMLKELEKEVEKAKSIKGYMELLLKISEGDKNGNDNSSGSRSNNNS